MPRLGLPRLCLHADVDAPYSKNAFSRAHVQKWHIRFDEARMNIHDEERSGQPSIISKEFIDAVKEIIKNGRYVMITDLCKAFMEVSRGTLHAVVRNCLWVSKQLIPDHLEKHMASSLEFLIRYHMGGGKTTFWVRLSNAMKHGCITLNLKELQFSGSI